MKYLALLPVLIFVLLCGCEKDPALALEEDDHATSGVPVCTVSWDLSCLSVGDTATYSIEVAEGRQSLWAISENEGGQFSIVDSSRNASVTVMAHAVGTALLNVSVVGDNYFCSYCKDICVD